MARARAGKGVRGHRKGNKKKKEGARKERKKEESNTKKKERKKQTNKQTRGGRNKDPDETEKKILALNIQNATN